MAPDADRVALATSLGVMTMTVNRTGIPGHAFVIQTSAGLLVDVDALTRGDIYRVGMPVTDVEGRRFVDLARIEGVAWTIAESEQRLDIVARPDLLPASRIRFELTPPELPQTPTWGGFLNYAIYGYSGVNSGFFRDDASYVSGAFEAAVFGPYGTGTATFIANPKGNYLTNGEKALLLEASWRYDDPARLTTLIAGDAITAPGWWGRAVRFGGVQYSSNFALQPGFVTYPLLTVAGLASVPTAAEIYNNNQRIGEQNVPAGPFSITNLPALNGAGEIQVVVRNALGQPTVISQPFYLTSQLLKPGLSQFSYSVGSERFNYGLRNLDYQGYIASAFYRYGVNDKLTVQGRGEIDDHVRGLGAGADWVVGNFGILSAGVAASDASGGGVGTVDGANGAGVKGLLGFSRQTPTVSFGAMTTWASANYREIGDTPLFEQRVSRAALNFALPGRAGALAFAWGGTRYVDNGPPDTSGLVRSGTLNTYVATYTLSLAQYGFLALSATRNTGLSSSTQLMALWTLPFGISATASADTTLTLGAQRAVYDGDGRNFGTLDIQHPLPVGIGWGYYLHAETDRNYTGGVSYYGKYGRYSLEGSSVSGESAVRASVAGGIGMVAGHPFIAPPIEQSFAVVEVGEQRGVRVLQENFEAGVTGADGTLVLSRLPSYTPVTVAIDPLSVPLDLAIGETEKKLVTLGRTGVLIRFEARKERSALVRIVTPDGKPLPEGAAVRVKGRTEVLPVAMGGEAFLTDLADEQDIEVMHRGRGCTIALHLDRASPPVADLGPFVCALEPLAGKAP